MKTRSNRIREKAEGELLENNKRKSLFKGIQIGLSVLLNTVLFYVLKQNFLSDDVFFRIFQIFIIVIVSVVVSNFIALGMILNLYKITSIKQFLTTDNSYVKFFLMALLYSFVTSICFSFGVFSILYSAFGDGTLITLIIWYAASYFIIEFFSYGLITWAFSISRAYKVQRGG